MNEDFDLDIYDEFLENGGAFPHCDAMVLHKPGNCQYCDMYPMKQLDRMESNTNFSDENDSTKLPCPSTYARSAEVRDKWIGNTPKPWNDDGEDGSFYSGV